MKRFLVIVLALSSLTLSFGNTVFAADATPAPPADELNKRLEESNKRLITLQEKTLLSVTKFNKELKAGLLSIAAQMPQAQQQYTDIALSKLTEADEGVRLIKNMLSLAKATNDIEHKRLLVDKSVDIMLNILSLHGEISELLEDLQEKLELDFPPASKKPTKFKGKAIG